MVGCTAGVRDAVIRRVITQEQVDGFEALLKARFGPSAGFHVLAGEQEGLLELDAARYCLSQVLPDEASVDILQAGMPLFRRLCPFTVIIGNNTSILLPY